MAVRSGAGTGVIVSLVVFVLTTVFLLVLSIVFYSGKNKALEAQTKAEDALAAYVRPQQRSSDQFKAFEQGAASNRQSVAEYLKSRNDDLMRFVNGDASVDLERLKADLSRYGVGDEDSVRGVLEKYNRTQRNQSVELEGRNGRISELQNELAQKQAQLDQMRQNHQQELEQVSRDVVTYRQAAEQYGTDVNDTIRQIQLASDRMQDDYAARESELEDELDRVNQELVLLRSRVDEYEAIFNDLRTKATSPELLVDGEVIDVNTANEQVFMNRGRRDHIVLGMTFEVYDDFGSIRIDPRTGALPRGKASVQVVKVAETTSTCKITRSVPGRPVTRNDVLANAIYDPTYQFKFMIHGKFDVDGDGRPSEAEAEYLRSLVVDWGGDIVMGSQLPGDLDFLVLGAQPPMPSPLGAEATPQQLSIWVESRRVRQEYDDLFRQASEAQIPILNANRFFILIGR